MRKPTSWWRATMVRVLVPLYLAIIVGGPLALVVAATRATRSPLVFYLLLALSPALYAIAYVLIAGLLCRLTIHAVTPGRYPRDVAHRVYGPRRLYAICWTAIYYCGPLFYAVLAIPLLKRLTLRLFGYRGSIDFQTYPDTWLRDLPLLSIGKGAYLSNKATISPNMCLKNGKIIVLPVSIGAGTMIGHLTMIAPGVDIGADSEVGVGAAIGVNACVSAHCDDRPGASDPDDSGGRGNVGPPHHRRRGPSRRPTCTLQGGMMMRARGVLTPLPIAFACLLAVFGASRPRPVEAQVSVIPSIGYKARRTTDSTGTRMLLANVDTVASADDQRLKTDFAQGTSVTGSMGKSAQADVSTQAVRFGVYGKAACAEGECVKHLWFSVNINSHIVDAFGQSTAAIKQYVLSDRGAPLTLALPANIPLLTFSTATPSVDVPESYVAGQLAGSARFIPVRLGDGKISNNGSLSIGYSFEGHIAFTFEGIDGSAFATLTPSYSYLLGDSLQAAISATPQQRSNVGGLSYRVGYQFGTGTAVSATGSYAFTSLRDGRRQLSLALNQAIGAIGGSR